MAGNKKKQVRKAEQQSVPQTIYFRCINPAACFFGEIVFNLHSRMMAAMIVSAILTLFSETYAICTSETCYSNFIIFLLNPSLLMKPFAFRFILVPAFFTFVALFIVWLALLTLFSWVQKTGKVHEMILPIVAVTIFGYMLFLVSGTIGPLFVHTGLVECIENTDCIKAGYVGEVCTSIYRPVYTEYKDGLKPVDTCSCIENKCIGTHTP